LSFWPDRGHKARQVPARLLKEPLGKAVTLSGRLRKLFAQTGKEGFLKACVTVLQQAKSAKKRKPRNHIKVLNYLDTPQSARGEVNLSKKVNRRPTKRKESFKLKPETRANSKNARGFFGKLHARARLFTVFYFWCCKEGMRRPTIVCVRERWNVRIYTCL
jgi:hypothetical protein